MNVGFSCYSRCSIWWLATALGLGVSHVDTRFERRGPMPFRPVHVNLPGLLVWVGKELLGLWLQLISEILFLALTVVISPVYTITKAFAFCRWWRPFCLWPEQRRAIGAWSHRRCSVFYCLQIPPGLSYPTGSLWLGFYHYSHRWVHSWVNLYQLRALGEKSLMVVILIKWKALYV